MYKASDISYSENESFTPQQLHQSRRAGLVKNAISREQNYQQTSTEAVNDWCVGTRVMCINEMKGVDTTSLPCLLERADEIKKRLENKERDWKTRKGLTIGDWKMKN